MGRKHRERRAEEKRLARWFGYKEDQFGKLTKIVSKAEARRLFLRIETGFHNFVAKHRKQIELDIINSASKKAHEDLCSQMDKDIFLKLTRSYEPTNITG